MNNRNKLLLTAATCIALLSAACSKSSLPPSPVVADIQTQRLTDRDSVAPGVSQIPSVQVTLTVNKDALFNQDFLYGADLQYSSVRTGVSAFENLCEKYPRIGSLDY